MEAMQQSVNKVEEIRHPVAASPLPTLGMIFAVLATLSWAISVGIIPPEGTLGLGIVSLAVFPSYAIAARNLLKTGDGFNGNIFSIFCCFFAAVGGVSSIMSWVSLTYGLPYPGQIVGIIWVLLGIELGMCLVPIWKHGYWSVMIQVTMATVGLLLNGLVGLGVIGAFGGVIGGWLFFFVAMFQLYFTGLEHVNQFGMNWSYGPQTPPAARESLAKGE